MNIEQENYNEQDPGEKKVLAYEQEGDLEEVTLEEAFERQMFILDEVEDE